MAMMDSETMALHGKDVKCPTTVGLTGRLRNPRYGFESQSLPITLYFVMNILKTVFSNSKEVARR